jgi:hypothetical protein
MNRLARTLTVASTLSLALVLSNCSSFDPTDIMDGLFASQKKPLQGERKPLFPQGTPGVSQGLPAELVKGYQPPPAIDATQDAQAAPAQPKAKAKSKPKVAATPSANQSRSSAATVPAPASTGSAASPSSPWPDPPPARQSARQSAAPSPGQVAWPDPPAPGTATR